MPYITRPEFSDLPKPKLGGALLKTVHSHLNILVSDIFRPALDISRTQRDSGEGRRISFSQLLVERFVHVSGRKLTGEPIDVSPKELRQPFQTEVSQKSQVQA